MELEVLAGGFTSETLPFPIVSSGDATWVMEPVPLLAALGERRRQGEDVAQLAAAFHTAVAEGAVRLALLAADREGLRTIALGGGVFQNARLLDTIRSGLEAKGLEVLVPRRLSPNDGAISYGQAAVGAARLAAGDWNPMGGC